MKDLIKAVQSALRSSGTLSYLRAPDIYISPTDSYLPTSVKSAAIGIVPGSEDREERLGRVLFVTRRIHVVLFVSLLKLEDGVISSPNSPGILDMTDHVDEVLDCNFLGLPAMESAFCRAMTDPDVFGNVESSGRFIIRRKLTYEYELEKERP